MQHREGETGKESERTRVFWLPVLDSMYCFSNTHAAAGSPFTCAQRGDSDRHGGIPGRGEGMGAIVEGIARMRA